MQAPQCTEPAVTGSSMSRLAVAYVVTLAVSCGLDFPWLLFVAAMAVRAMRARVQRS